MMNVETKIKQKIDEYIGKAGSAIPYNKLLADVLTSIIDAQQPIVLFPSSINERALSKKSYLKVIDAYKENKMQNLVLSISEVSGDIDLSNITDYGFSAENHLNLGWIKFGETATFPVCWEAVMSANEELPIDGFYTTSAIANAFGLSEDDWLALWNGEIVVACPNMDSEFHFDCLGFTDEGDPNMKYLGNVIFDKLYRYFRVIRYTDEDKWQIISVVDNA